MVCDGCWLDGESGAVGVKGTRWLREREREEEVREERRATNAASD